VELSNTPEQREPAPFIPRPPGPDRDGSSVLERKAVYRVQLEIAAMPASLVIQILLWPEKLTDWAREEAVTPALVYNMLGGFKPYHDLRHRLAERLGVSKGALDHLIDGRRPQPTGRRLPDPPAEVALPASGGVADLRVRGNSAEEERAAGQSAAQSPGEDAPPDSQIGLEL
jgi:hypothetical protein